MNRPVVDRRGIVIGTAISVVFWAAAISLVRSCYPGPPAAAPPPPAAGGRPPP